MTHMCITEYDEDKAFAALKAEAREEGIEEGRAEARAEARAEVVTLFADLVRERILTLADAAKRIGMSVSEFESATGLKVADYN